MYIKALYYSFIPVLALLISACESDQIDKLTEAQDCINTATPGSVGSCRSLLDGMNSEQSFILRCSIDFIAEGFTTKTMATAFQNINSKSGVNQTSVFMGFLVFSSTTSANRTFDDCNASKEPSYVTLASFVKVSTLAASTAGLLTGGALDRNAPIDLNTAIGTLISTPSSYSTVGDAVQTAYTSNCSSPANQSSSVCVKIVASMSGGGTSADIGLRFLNALLTP